MKEDNYCGFVCSDYVEKAKEIRKALDEFAKYNPEEARVVLGNILDTLVPDSKPLISQYLNEYRRITDEELGIRRLPDEIVCQYCAGSVKTYSLAPGKTKWTCDKCGKSGLLPEWMTRNANRKVS